MLRWCHMRAGNTSKPPLPPFASGHTRAADQLTSGARIYFISLQLDGFCPPISLHGEEGPEHLSNLASANQTMPISGEVSRHHHSTLRSSSAWLGPETPHPVPGSLATT